MDVALARRGKFPHDHGGGDFGFSLDQRSQIRHTLLQSRVFESRRIIGANRLRGQLLHILRQFAAEHGALNARCLHTGALLRRCHIQNRPVEIVALGFAADLIRIVEKRKNLIKLALADGVEFMIVAARAADGQAQERCAGGCHAVGHSLYAVLFEVDASFKIAGRISVKAGGHQLILGWIRQQIPGNLFNDELIERQVAIQRVNHPIAILPDLARSVDGVSVGVGVTGDIQPVASPSLAVMLRRQ